MMEAGKFHASTCPASHYQKQVLTLPGRKSLGRNGGEALLLHNSRRTFSKLSQRLQFHGKCNVI